MSDPKATIRAALDALRLADAEQAKAEVLLAEEERRTGMDRRDLERGGGRRADDPEERLLSVRSATRWLKAHGIAVHENTVRYWYQSGRIQVVRAVREEAPAPKGGGNHIEVWIPLATLQKIVDCPFCSSR